MSNLEPPTLSEVVRLITSLSEKIDSMTKSFVIQEVYLADRKGIEQKFERSHEIHLEINSDLSDLRAQMAARELALSARETAAKERQTRYNLVILGASLSSLSALALALFNRAVIGG